MKKIICIVLVVAVMALSGCGHPKTINGTTYPTRGLFQEKNPNIHYEVSVGNVVWSIILVETIIAPVYFVGWSIYNPICKDTDYVAGVGCKE